MTKPKGKTMVQMVEESHARLFRIENQLETLCQSMGAWNDVNQIAESQKQRIDSLIATLRVITTHAQRMEREKDMIVRAVGVDVLTGGKHKIEISPITDSPTEDSNGKDPI